MVATVREPWSTDVAPWAPLDTMRGQELVSVLGWASFGVEWAAERREEAIWRDMDAQPHRAALRYWRAVHREAEKAVAQRLYEAERP